MIGNKYSATVILFRADIANTHHIIITQVQHVEVYVMLHVK